MPGLNLVQLYLRGVWLLFVGESDGLKFLDCSERGVLRSFYSIVYVFPTMLITWVWWHQKIAGHLPANALGGVFYLRMAMMDVASWIFPLLLLTLLARPLGYAARLDAMIVSINWLSVPAAYASAFITAILLIMPNLAEALISVRLTMLVLPIYACYRLFKVLVDGQRLLATALTLILFVPSFFVDAALQTFLNLSLE